MKRIICLALILGQIGILSPFDAQAEDAYIRPATEEEIQKALTQSAQKEIVELVQSYMGGHIDRFSTGEEFRGLIHKWVTSHVSPEVLVSTWNSYFIAIARIILSRYQADLWKSDLSKDEEISDSYSQILRKVGISSKLLELHGRGSQSFEEASNVFQFLEKRRDFILSIGGEITEDGFDLNNVDFIALKY